jgi:hypothetical protein
VVNQFGYQTGNLGTGMQGSQLGSYGMGSQGFATGGFSGQPYVQATMGIGDNTRTLGVGDKWASAANQFGQSYYANQPASNFAGAYTQQPYSQSTLGVGDNNRTLGVGDKWASSAYTAGQISPTWGYTGSYGGYGGFSPITTGTYGQTNIGFSPNYQQSYQVPITSAFQLQQQIQRFRDELNSIQAMVSQMAQAEQSNANTLHRLQQTEFSTAQQLQQLAQAERQATQQLQHLQQMANQVNRELQQISGLPQQAGGQYGGFSTFGGQNIGSQFGQYTNPGLGSQFGVQYTNPGFSGQNFGRSY